jgi:hypothetical protein
LYLYWFELDLADRAGKTPRIGHRLVSKLGDFEAILRQQRGGLIPHPPRWRLPPITSLDARCLVPKTAESRGGGEVNPTPIAIAGRS